jgi:hypothetical protein
MPETWVPLEALERGQLPPLCLITGRADAAVREQRIAYAANPTERGSALTTPGSVAIGSVFGPGAAVVVASLKAQPYVLARVPLSSAGAQRLMWTRPLSWAVVATNFFSVLVLAGLTRSPVVALLSLIAAVVGTIAFGVWYGRKAGLALLKRQGNEVLLDLPNEQAAQAIAAAFPKSVDVGAHSVG